MPLGSTIVNRIGSCACPCAEGGRESGACPCYLSANVGGEWRACPDTRRNGRARRNLIPSGMGSPCGTFRKMREAHQLAGLSLGRSVPLEHVEGFARVNSRHMPGGLTRFRTETVLPNTQQACGCHARARFVNPTCTLQCDVFCFQNCRIKVLW